MVKYGAICLIIFCACAAVALNAPVAAAFSWAEGALTVYRSEPEVIEDQPDCSTYEQKLHIDGLVNDQMICMLGGGVVRVGSFRDDGGRSRAAISFPFDSDFRILSGVCEGVPGCLYSADRDMLVSRYGLGLRVYEGVAGRVHRGFDPDYPLTARYEFDTSNPSYESMRPIGAMALSRNGKWLAMEIKNLGIGLVSLETGVARRVIAPGYQYNRGSDPHEELAVSNDGSSVVVMGDNAGLAFVSVDPECGDILIADLAPSFPFGVKLCAGVNIDPSLFIQSFSVALSPTFDDSGGQLEFVAGSKGLGSRRVVLRAAGYEGVPGLSYLALGDSFSSGEGETDDAHYEAGTDDGFENCHVSIRSYPFLLGTAMQLASSDVKNIACSGAKTRDIHTQEIGYWGQGGRLGPLGLDLSTTNLLGEQANGLLGFLPGRVPQERFIERYQPDVVTVGIAGNDAGLMDKLKVCAMPGTCEWAATQRGEHSMGLEIQGLFYKLVNLYHQVRLDGPFAHFYAVGYPEIMSSGGTCDPLTSVLFNNDERSLASEGISYLNQVIKAAASAVKIRYLDIEESLSGHELCASSGEQTAVNGLRFGNDIALTSWLPMLKIIGKESFHPNPIGHELIAQAILRQQPDLRASNDCSSCEVASEPPPLPANWSMGDDGAASVNEDFVTPSDILRTTPTLAVSLPAGSLEPESIANLEVHSDAVKLGEFKVAGDGSLNVIASLPATLEEGFHTIHLYGDSFLHQAVDVYQVISFGDQPAIQEASSVSPLITEHRSMGVAGYFGDKVKLGVNSAQRIKSESVIGTHRLTSIAIIGGMILISSGLVGFVLWRGRHNSSQDRGG